MRSIVCGTVLICSGYFGLRPLLAASPTPGTPITNQATGSFIDTGDNVEKATESNVVTLAVAEVAGITVTANGVTGIANPGATVYYSFKITNVGNDPTQFFIPDLANILSSNATQSGNVEITSYNLDGTTSTSTSVVVPSGGQQTGSNGTVAGLLGTGSAGVFLPGGSVTVRVPVLINANATGTVDVQLGDTPVDPLSSATPPARLENQSYIAGSRDVYTVDNPDSLDPTLSAGMPINGDPITHRQEASAVLSQAVISAPLCTNSAADGSYATSGIRKNSIWWLNFECYNDITAATPAGQPFSFNLPDGSTMTLTVNKLGTGTSDLKTTTAPTYGGAAFGNGNYDGIPGKPIFYATTTPTAPYMWQETLSNIVVKDKAGNVRNYGFVAADGESTGAGGGTQEQLTFNTIGGTPWSQLEIIQQSGTSAVLAGTGTSTATWTGSGSNVNGSVILSTTSPTQVSVKSQPLGNGGGAEGALFGIALPKVTLIKNINGRVAPADQFTTEIDYTSPTVQLQTATSTGTATTTTTGAISVLPGNVVNLKETMAAGSTSALTAYEGSIACVQNSTVATTTVLPSGTGTSFNITPQLGDDITCTLTNKVKIKPNVLLIKRITAINGVPVNTYKDDTISINPLNDNDTHWPSPLNTDSALGDTSISTYIKGAINGGIVKPGDEIEYTIYFLNAGGNANTVRICDLLTPHQNYRAGSMQLQLGASSSTSLTDIQDSTDRGEFVIPTNPLPTNCNLSTPSTNSNGVVVIDITGTNSPVLPQLLESTAPGTPNESYGFIRFKANFVP